MTTLGTAKQAARTTSSPAGLDRATRRAWLGLNTDTGLAIVLGAALAALAFVSGGGADLEPDTWVEIALIAIGATLAIGAVLRSAAAPVWGLVTVVLFVAVAALAMVSISWSVQPADSWVAANQTIAYLVAFAGAAALARLAPERWPALLGAIAITTTVVCGYALLVKVFPGSLDGGEVLGRLRAPLDYWNAVGLLAALGLAPCLWAGARPEGKRIVRALTVPALAVLLVTLVLSYSRGALAVAVAGLVLWFAVVPLRLRGALVLGVGALGAAAVAAWALSTPAITHDLVSLRSRTAAGHDFGLLLLLVVVALAGGGCAAALAMDRVPLTAGIRRRIGIALVVLVACFPAGGVVALAVSSRGLTGQVSHIWQRLTNTNGGAGDSAGRLVQVSNSRARYWTEGLKVGEHAWFKGVGAAGYGTARNRYSRDFRLAQHAHSYVIETFADFGVLGLCLSLALLVGWGVAAARAVGARLAPAAVPRERIAERAGLLTLVVVVVTFGLHSAIDWTWFIPAAAVPALVCAGWLAGRGPLARPVGRLARPADGGNGRSEHPPRRERIALGIRAATGAIARSPLRSGMAAALGALAIVSAWTVWQPLRSAHAEQAALAELGAGHVTAALADARTARARDPFAVTPLWDLSVIYDVLGDRAAARLALVQAVHLQPSNASTWVQLAQYDLKLGQLQEATAVLRTALELGPHERDTLAAVEQLQAAQAGAAAAALTQRRGRGRPRGRRPR